MRDLRIHGTRHRDLGGFRRQYHRGGGVLRRARPLCGQGPRHDQLGAVFAHDLRSTGVGYTTPPATGGPPTGRCLILITPDAQRTMHTFLGASVHLWARRSGGKRCDRTGKDPVPRGYLLDPAAAQEAFRVAAGIAHAAGRKVSLTLSDPFCVDRHRAAFLDLVEHHVDVLFGNEAEICALYQVGDFDTALQQVRRHCEVAALSEGPGARSSSAGMTCT